jgi:hypothetical protein
MLRYSLPVVDIALAVDDRALLSDELSAFQLGEPKTEKELLFTEKHRRKYRGVTLYY